MTSWERAAGFRRRVLCARRPNLKRLFVPVGAAPPQLTEALPRGGPRRALPGGHSTSTRSPLVRAYAQRRPQIARHLVLGPGMLIVGGKNRARLAKAAPGAVAGGSEPYVAENPGLDVRSAASYGDGFRRHPGEERARRVSARPCLPECCGGGPRGARPCGRRPLARRRDQGCAFTPGPRGADRHDTARQEPSGHRLRVPGPASRRAASRSARSASSGTSNRRSTAISARRHNRPRPLRRRADGGLRPPGRVRGEGEADAETRSTATRRRREIGKKRADGVRPSSVRQGGSFAHDPGRSRAATPSPRWRSVGARSALTLVEAVAPVSESESTWRSTASLPAIEQRAEDVPQQRLGDPAAVGPTRCRVAPPRSRGTDLLRIGPCEQVPGDDCPSRPRGA